MLAPIKSKSETHDAIYNYLRLQHTLKQRFEAARLLYVAATRTKQQLYLLTTNDYDDIENFKPASSSFLAMLWPSCQTLFKPATAKIVATKQPSTCLRRIVCNQPTTNEKNIIYHATNRPLLIDNNARHIGTLIHELLYQCSKTNNWQTCLANKDYWLSRMQQLGISDKTLAWQQLQKTLTTCVNSKKAQWILQQQEAQSEYPLTAYINNQLQHIIIDQTFVDNGFCWIIDYKTSQPANKQSLDDFLQQQKTNYFTQLDNYPQILSIKHSMPIKLCLYFPLIDQWIEWPHQPSVENCHESIKTV